MKKKRILLVDDEPDICKTLAKQLREDGYDVKYCFNGKEALECLKEDYFELAIVDKKMPKIDGIALLGELKNKYPMVGGLLLTGYDLEKSEIQPLLRSQSYDFIRKPIKDLKLFSEKTVKRAFKINVKREKLYYKNYLCDEIVEKCESLELFNYNRLFGKNGSFIRDYFMRQENIDKTINRAIKKIFKDIKTADKKFYNALKMFCLFEDILKEERSYKEHFIHQFQNFLLGCWIIEQNIDIFLRTFKDAYLLKGSKKEIIKDIIFSWFLTTIMHDIGYSLQNFHTWMNSYFKGLLELPAVIPVDLDLEKTLIKEDIQLDIEQIAETFWDRKADRFNAFLQMLMKSLVVGKNHGVISALSLKRLFQKSIEKDKELVKRYHNLKTIVKHACLAICMHDFKTWKNAKCIRSSLNELGTYCYDIDFRFIFEKHPLTFLLVYCDNIQEWGRPLGRTKEIESVYTSNIELISLGCKKEKGIQTVFVNLKLKDDKKKSLSKRKEIFFNLTKILKSKRINFRIILSHELSGKNPLVFNTRK